MAVSLGIPRVLPTAGVPERGGLTDRYGRVATDLRLSLTDKCNLRCTYCMPADGMDWLPRAQLLTAGEITRLVGIAVDTLGVVELRLTGGEPLIRPDLEDVVAGVRGRHPDLPISLTTNGVGLDRRAASLRDAGLSRINISLDTLCPETFAALSRRNLLERTLAGIAAADAAGLSPVKINAVLMRGVNEDEAGELAAWCLARGYELRFIEQMPLDADHGWRRDTMVTAAQIRAHLERDFALTPHPAKRDGAPAERYTAVARRDPAVHGTLGIIASVTEPFCADCKRTRLTADGKVRSCLFSHEEVDLLHLLRGGADDEQLAQRWRQAMWVKPLAHGTESPGTEGLDASGYVQPDRSMSAIGG
ncbi:cyclic pyranopterin monophosphate synthase [Tersicoccus solisilvae]|uniref:GTP 3',8-cyclase n=1 Tax=Tersicoccus solisilvae TaxID=1882339 RepID=A0ABQ1NJ06_9MICC|nr:GTP 3',8-cyclase MoaA [Tersicoccus solisilvae]GGC78411.1 cyclic pyranopterin monophosphate synthase [Tersicoccus solisilvae]